MWFVILFLFLVGLFVFLEIKGSNDRKESINQQIASSGFNATYRVDGINHFYTLCIDQTDRKVLITTPARSYTLSFEEIMSVNVVIDGDVVASRSLSKVVGATLVAGVVGAIAVDSKIKKKVNDIHVDINTRNFSYPCITLNVVNTQTEIIEMYVNEANRVANYIKVIIDENEHRYQAELAAAQTAALAQSAQPAPAPSAAHSVQSSQTTRTSSHPISVADEIRKFSELLEAGIITETEFQDYKQSLLQGALKK